MKAVVQRVTRAQVRVDDAVVGAIDHGLLILLGIARGDEEDQAVWLARKIAALRIFSGEGERFDYSVRDVGGAALVVSQFTLLGTVQQGTRPDFGAAMPSSDAQALYERFCELLADEGVPVERGVFGASMQVELVNDGPVTITIER